MFGAQLSKDKTVKCININLLKYKLNKTHEGISEGQNHRSGQDVRETPGADAMIEAIWTQRKERGTTRGSRPFDYGLIRVKGAGAGSCDLFFHKSNIAAGVESGALKLETRVRFRTSRSDRGPYAKDMRPAQRCMGER